MRVRLLLLSCLISVFALAIADNSGHLSESWITIQPHTRSAALNAKHAAQCAEMGGVDVTDSSVMGLGEHTIDAELCKIIDHSKYQKYIQLHGSNTYSNSNNYSQNVSGVYNISNVIAPNGYTDDLPFTISGSAVFHTDTSRGYGYISTGISSAGCEGGAGYKLFESETSTMYSLNAICDAIGPRYGKYGTITSACRYQPSSGCYNPIVEESGVFEFRAPPKPTPEPTPDEVDKNMGAQEDIWSCNMPRSYFGNPINILVGNKFQQEVDLQFNGGSTLDFIKSYNSMDGLWRHNYSTRLDVYQTVINMFNADGRATTFTNEFGEFKSSPSELGTLVKVGNGYQYTSPFHDVYDFDATGHLTRTVSNGGIVHTLKWLSQNEFVVSDTSGHSLTITETKDHQPLSVKSSSGKTVNYEYDGQNRLVKMTKNGKSRSYHYEDSRFPRALTGITDENGIRYATWTYDDKGRANSSSHTGGKDKVTVVYNSGTQTTMTNPLGRSYVYNYTSIDGVKRITSIQGNASSQCPAIGSSYDYNDRGLVAYKTDGKGIKTVYVYNQAGQEISRTIANGRGEGLTIKTTWDTRFNLPKTETYPNKVISYDYDDKGNLISSSVQSLN